MRAPSQRFWSGRRVFLTGHTGFKGAWLTLLLHRLGAEVHGFSLPEPVSEDSLFDLAGLHDLCHDVRGDIRDRDQLGSAMRRTDASAVIHMAAQSIVTVGFTEPVDTMAVNVMGTANLLDAARTCPGLALVGIVTSDKCYENREHVWPYRELDAMGGHDPYSASKGAAELVACCFARSFFETGARVVSLRAGNVIGGGDRAARRLLPDLVRGASSGDVIRIRNPHSVRPWQHVLDPLCGYLLALETAAERTQWSGFDSWNFGPNPGEELPVAQIVEVFQSAWPGALTVEFGDEAHRLHEAGLLRVDPTKAKIELGWGPLTTNRQAVAAVVDWSRDVLAGASPRQRTLAEIDALLGF